MLIADDVIVNPAAAPGSPTRAPKSLSEMGLSVRGADWGESASGVSGTSEPKTRAIVLTLAVREDTEADLPTAAYELQQLVGQMQEEAETWIERAPEVGGDFAGPVMYRIRRAPTSEEPAVSLANFGGWQAGESPDVTLTIVADFRAFSTEEEEGEAHATTTNRHLVYTSPAAKGSLRGLNRTRVTNNNSAGKDLRGLIFARECRDYDPAVTAEPFYEAQKLTPKGTGEVKEVGGVKVIQATLGAGWQTILGTAIAGVGHMTHRGGRRPWVRVLDPGAVVNNIQLRLVWRALGAARWEEKNAIAPVYVVGDYALLDLGSVLPQVALLGDQRWEGKVMARALSGSGTIRVRDFYVPPTEQYMVLSEPEEAPLDGEPARTPGTVANVAGVGTVAWTNPGNAKVPGGKTVAEAKNATKAEPITSNYLQATNLGFALPAAAVVKGIKVAAYRSKGLVTGAVDAQVRIVKAGVIQAQDKSSAEGWPEVVAPKAYGGLGDLWGTTWTPADINNAGFGAALAVTVSDGPTTTVAYVEGFLITVYYTEVDNENTVCFATRALELRTDGVARQGPESDVWGEVTPDGFLPYAAPASLEGRTQRTLIIPTRGDLVSRADASLPNKVTAQDFIRPAYHVAREAA